MVNRSPMNASEVFKSMDTKSFAVCMESRESIHITIDKVHLNIWQLPQNLFIDVGIQFNTDKETLQKNKSIVIDLYTPFIVAEDKIYDLFKQLKNPTVAQLIFNDIVNELKPMNTIPEIQSSLLISFNERGNLLLISVKQIKIAKNRISLCIETDDIKYEELGDNCHCYIRFRFKSSLVSSNVCSSQEGGFSDKVYYDIRFNEMRLLPEEELKTIKKNMLQIKNFYIFIIQDFNYKIILCEENKLKYMRLLEKGHFAEYIEELGSIKGHFIVYYWKYEDQNELNILVGFEKQKVSYKQFQAGVSVNLFSSAILIGNNTFFANYTNLQSIAILTFIVNIFFSTIFVLSMVYGIYKFISFLKYITKLRKYGGNYA